MLALKKGDSDNAWEHFGAVNPYFGVLTNESFQPGNLDNEGREVFFGTGVAYVEHILDVIRSHVDPSFSPSRVLDFGCGVGRLTLPLAQMCDEAVGVDISAGMLAEAASNAREHGIDNVRFVQSDDALSEARGQFDLINSIIVFQHIAPARGEEILRTMLSRLNPNGVTALQFTYSYASGVPTSRRLLTSAYGQVPFAKYLYNLAKRRPLQEPMMQMHSYDLNRLHRVFQEEGCHAGHVRYTETSVYGHPFYGVQFFLQKRTVDTRAFS